MGGPHERVADHADPQLLRHQYPPETEFAQKPSLLYLAALSLVIVSDASVISLGTCSSTRSDMPLPWAIRRASEMADDAIDGLYVTVAFSTLLSALIAPIAALEPAPPTMKNSLRPACLIAASTPMP